MRTLLRAFIVVAAMLSIGVAFTAAPMIGSAIADQIGG